ncbi:hypothetical protein [Hydrogenophaga sp.]|uniref:hypothetical protein n=1 Tax=Hydrogenophaga sp. TaxID=1904254 RepID=UPI002FC9CE11
MLNISSTSAVSWPTPVSTAVAPVTPVAAVQPMQASGGSDGQTQTGFGREGRAPQQRHTAAGRSGTDARAPAEAAPAALPRDPNALPKAPALPDVATQRQARQEAAKLAEKEKARDRQAIEHLQTMLSNMWEASAAVVDRALGREPAAPGNQSDTVPDLSQVAASTIPRKPLVPDRPQTKPAQEPLPWPNGPDGVGGEEDLPPEEVRVAEVVAYDERGASSLAPLEAGSLISHRV